MSLQNRIKRGVSTLPLRIVLYGPEGIGKTTFAAGAPNVVFLGTEDGFGTLSVERFEAPANWSALLDDVRALISQPHEYKTLALDTLDWLESLLWRHICDLGEVDSIEKYGQGFGKGYVRAVELFDELLRMLDELRVRRGMHIVCLAHSHIKTVKNPTGADYDRFQLKMNDKAAAKWREWADVLLFATRDTEVKLSQRMSADKALFAKGKAVGGARVIYTSSTEAFEAKNRHHLPAKLPLAWDAFAKAIKIDASGAEAAAALKAELEAARKELIDLAMESGNEKTIEWARAKAPTFTDLAKIKVHTNSLKTKLAEAASSAENPVEKPATPAPAPAPSGSPEKLANRCRELENALGDEGIAEARRTADIAPDADLSQLDAANLGRYENALLAAVAA